MSMRRKDDGGGGGKTAAADASAPESLGLAFITDTGFGVCTNGAIGFADDVTGPEHLHKDHARATPVVVASGAPPSADDFGVMSNRDAQNKMASMMLTTCCKSSSGGCSEYCQCADGGIVAPSSSSASRFKGLGAKEEKYCQCADGGITAATSSYSSSASRFKRLGRENKVSSLGSSYSSSNYNSKRRDQDCHSEEFCGYHYDDRDDDDHHLGSAAPTYGGGGLLTAKDIVFKAVTGIPYTAAAAKHHKVVDIFNTFRDGVPTNESMSPAEKAEAEMMSSKMAEARIGVMEAVQTGLAIDLPLENTLREIHKFMTKWAKRGDLQARRFLNKLTKPIHDLDKERDGAIRDPETHHTESDDRLRGLFLGKTSASIASDIFDAKSNQLPAPPNTDLMKKELVRRFFLPGRDFIRNPAAGLSQDQVNAMRREHDSIVRGYSRKDARIEVLTEKEYTEIRRATNLGDKQGGLHHSFLTAANHAGKLPGVYLVGPQFHHLDHRDPPTMILHTFYQPHKKNDSKPVKSAAPSPQKDLSSMPSVGIGKMLFQGDMKIAERSAMKNELIRRFRLPGPKYCLRNNAQETDEEYRKRCENHDWKRKNALDGRFSVEVVGGQKEDEVSYIHDDFMKEVGNLGLPSGVYLTAYNKEGYHGSGIKYALLMQVVFTSKRWHTKDVKYARNVPDFIRDP